jgi:predicted esterase
VVGDVAQADRVLVLLHGRWYKPASMLELAKRLKLRRTACVAPVADDRTWYPQRFMDPRAANEPRLSEAIDRVHGTLDGLEGQGVDPERVVLGGFSQGSCVACEALARRPRPLAALVSLCGGLVGKTDAEIVKPPAGALDGLPVLLTGTEEDDWIPVPRVRRTAEVLEAAGARVDLRIHPPASHEVHPWEVEAFRRLMLELG